VFKEMDADITLYSLIFGESIFNDAISIVLYNTVVAATDVENMSYKKEVTHSIAEFLIVLIGSVMIGALSALLIAFILKR
jgi:NhaP-type Na+/H+ or K+/H+ antiporter